MRLALALLLLAVAGCGGGREEPEQPSAQRRLVDVRSVSAFGAAFDEDGDVPRLILVLSPT